MIFISYRKEDSGDLALTLASRLNEAFGEKNVFFDRKGIALGDNWMQKINTALSNSKVVLALIGRRWLTTYDEFGQRRIDKEDDILSYELFMALQKGIIIIPLYLHGTSPLSEQAFPNRLKKIAFSHGQQFDIEDDISVLLKKIESITGIIINTSFRQKEDIIYSGIIAKNGW